MLSSFKNKIKSLGYGNLTVLFLMLILAFQLGKITTQSTKEVPIKLEAAALNQIFEKPNSENKQNEVFPQTTSNPKIPQVNLKVVVSKASNSKVYHFLWCAGAKRIKQENLIEFASETEAISKGYTLAGNCKK
ncbi:MAG: hypothetical protein HYW77_01675 [Parcubacteria group bacterium]|nr:hypothetical protein [Parcubacteria group bacterium]